MDVEVKWRESNDWHACTIKTIGETTVDIHYAKTAQHEEFDETLLFYPPGGALTGRGRILVCSNYHWLCDMQHWNGGHFRRFDAKGELMLTGCLGEDGEMIDEHAEDEDYCCRLLLNFIAGALAARVHSHVSD